MLKKIIRWSLGIFAVLLLLLAGAVWYANDYLESSQEKLLQDYMATQGLSVSFREVRLEIWKDWPQARMTVDSLVVRDTTQATRVPELINARRVRTRVSLEDLFAGRIRIREITVIDAAVHLESDSAGVFNYGYLGNRDTTLAAADTTETVASPRLPQRGMGRARAAPRRRRPKIHPPPQTETDRDPGPRRLHDRRPQ